MKRKPNQITTPVLEFKMRAGNTIRVWVLDPGQYCILGPTKSFEFPHNPSDGTSSLIYETIGPEGHNATEYHIESQSTWSWIHEWMSKGFKAEGLL